MNLKILERELRNKFNFAFFDTRKISKFIYAFQFYKLINSSLKFNLNQINERSKR